ncbi:MAG: aromatic hydrocarbon degradation protein [Prevotella sp.]|jgi:long-chain fatty acid transport protein|nr:aromatic hydrocarbon degradation protein [Prevotella sp.]
MKKNVLIFTILITLFNTITLFAGGILTNTNQSAHFIRMVARDASTQIDAAYTNPAGLVKLKEGFHFSFTNQSAFQTRTITSTFPLFQGFGGNQTKVFKGEASAPIVPSLQAAYKKGKWVLSGSIAVTGGGGKATFNNGLPSFESGMALTPIIVNGVGQGLTAMNENISLTAKNYSVDQYMTGSSFIYGAQIGGSYAINNMFSVYGGFRLNIVNNGYEGHLRDLQTEITSSGLSGIGLPKDYNGTLANPSPFLQMAIANTESQADKQSLQLLNKASTDGVYLDCSQSGWGISPILGFNFNYDKLNIGMKYEFRTALNVENKTKKDDTGMFADGVNTPHDIPALFTVGASYLILPKLTASVGYHHFFDSDADMADDKQKHINGGTDEYLIGFEYRIDRMFLISAGGQITRYGVKDAYQRDLSFSLNSYSIGLGGAVNVAKNVMINVGYFWTNYSDWTKKTDSYIASKPELGGGTDVFSRTNKVFAAGVDFSF